MSTHRTLAGAREWHLLAPPSADITAEVSQILSWTFPLFFSYVTSWIDTRQAQSERANLTILFDKYVPYCLEQVRCNLKTITPIPETSMVQVQQSYSLFLYIFSYIRVDTKSGVCARSTDTVLLVGLLVNGWEHSHRLSSWTLRDLLCVCLCVGFWRCSLSGPCEYEKPKC